MVNTTAPTARTVAELAALPLGPVKVTHPSTRGSDLLPGADAAARWLQRHQPMSTEWAMAHEGWRVESQGYAPWDVDEQRALVNSAGQQRQHQHPMRHASREDRILTEENCGACALEGKHPTTEGDSGHLEPNYAGWERHYVQTGTPVRERYRAAFEAALQPHTAYAYALGRDLATWGVHFTD